jgi:hypothetical protein
VKYLQCKFLSKSYNLVRFSFLLNIYLQFGRKRKLSCVQKSAPDPLTNFGQRQIIWCVLYFAVLVFCPFHFYSYSLPSAGWRWDCWWHNGTRLLLVHTHKNHMLFYPFLPIIHFLCVIVSPPCPPVLGKVLTLLPAASSPLRPGCFGRRLCLL